jgi:hypothetical protein
MFFLILSAISSVFCAEPKIDRPDLDVVFISRMPRYPSLHARVTYNDLNKPRLIDPQKDGNIAKFFPTAGEKVTFTAHFTNKGPRIAGNVAYVWKIDGKEAGSGACGAPGYNEVATQTMEWIWQDGPHTVTFQLDPGGAIDDFAAVNNQKTDRTDALGFLFFCRRDAYDRWNSEKNMRGTYSFEDWMNWHFDDMNRQFAEAVYPSCPDGCHERVRVDNFVVVDDQAQFAKTDNFGYSGYWDFRETHEPVAKPDGGLIHELGHQLGLIDQYGLYFPLYMNRLLNRYGEPIMKGYAFFQMNTNMFDPNAFRWSELTAAALNRQKGYPRGYFGTYLFDHAQGYSIRVLDRAGNPLGNADVTYYRSLAGMRKQQDGSTDARGLMQLANDNTPFYRIPYSPFAMKPTPFGTINILGSNSMLCFHVRANGQEDFVMTEAAWFLVSYWRSGDTHTIVDLKTSIGPPGGPEPPASVRAIWAPGSRVRLTWVASESGGAISYRVYRSHLASPWSADMVGPDQIGKDIKGTEFDCPSPGPAMMFFVTAVNEQGIEGAASRQLWVPHPRPLNEPMHVAYDWKNDRVILSSGEQMQSLSEKRGFWPITYWDAGYRGVAMNADGDLLAVVANAILLFDMSAPTPEAQTITYGGIDGEPRFKNPRDVAVDGKDTVVVADTGNGRAVVLSRSGKVVALLGGEGPDDGKIQEPVSVAILPDGAIALGDAKLHGILIATLDEKGGAAYRTLPLPAAASYPADLLVDAQGRLIVVDSGTKSVYVAPHGAGADNDRFTSLQENFVNPTSAAILNDGSLLVYDSGKEGMDAFVITKGNRVSSFMRAYSADRNREYSCIPPRLLQNYVPSVDRAAWHIVGPFPNDGMEGFDTAYPPENEKRFDFGRDYASVYGKNRWQELPPRGCPDGEFINFDRCFTPNDNVCAYAAAVIVSDIARQAKLLTGSDDTITVWLNGENVVSKKGPRGATKDEDQVLVTLKAGENRVLVKVCDAGGGWGFYFRVADPASGAMPADLRYKHGK